VAFFADTGQFYDCTRLLFDRIQDQEPSAADGITAAHMVFRLRCSRPSAEITLNGRKRPLEIVYGPARPRPTLDIELAADTLHRIMLGEDSLKGALANGSLKVNGPVWRVKGLADLFSQARELYPQVLRDAGLVPA
jgi:hypothetical protein